MNLARARLLSCTSIVLVGRERARLEVCRGWRKDVPCAMESLALAKVIERAQDRSLALAKVLERVQDGSFAEA